MQEHVPRRNGTRKAPTLTPKATEDLVGVEAVGVIEVTATLLPPLHCDCPTMESGASPSPAQKAPGLTSHNSDHVSLPENLRDCPVVCEIIDVEARVALEDYQECMLCNLPRA